MDCTTTVNMGAIRTSCVLFRGGVVGATAGVLDSNHGETKTIASEEIEIFSQKQQENGGEEEIGGAKRQRARQTQRSAATG